MGRFLMNEVPLYFDTGLDYVAPPGTRYPSLDGFMRFEGSSASLIARITCSCSYLRLIHSCITQLKTQGSSRTCNESKEEEEDHLSMQGTRLPSPHKSTLGVCTRHTFQRAFGPALLNLVLKGGEVERGADRARPSRKGMHGGHVGFDPQQTHFCFL